MSAAVPRYRSETSFGLPSTQPISRRYQYGFPLITFLYRLAITLGHRTSGRRKQADTPDYRRPDQPEDERQAIKIELAQKLGLGEECSGQASGRAACAVIGVPYPVRRESIVYGYAVRSRDASGASGVASNGSPQRHAGRCSCRSAHGCPRRAEPGSGVFALAAGSHALVFTYQGQSVRPHPERRAQAVARCPRSGWPSPAAGSYSGRAHLDDQGPGRPPAGSALRSRTTGSSTRCS